MNRFIKLVLLFFVPYLVLVVFFAVKGVNAIEGLPKWSLLVMVCYFVGSIGAIGLLLRRGKHATSVAGTPSGSAANIRLLKFVVILYALGILAGARVIGRRGVPLEFGILALVVNVLVLCLLVWTLYRWKNAGPGAAR